MVGKVIPANKDEREHQNIIRTYCGCLPCILEGKFDTHATIQHVTEGYRVGQWAVYGACIWHHLGQTFPDSDFDYMAFHYGPSLFHNKRLYVETYGNERLLMELQNYMVEQWRADPWQPYSVPVTVLHNVRSFWVMLLNK